MKTAGIFLSILTLLFTTAFSQPGGSPQNREHHMWANMGLSEEQKGKLKTLHEEMNGIRKQNFDAVKAVRDKIRDELLKDNPSKGILDGYAADLGNLHKQMTSAQTDHLLKVKQVLTPEQFSKLVNQKRRGEPGKFKAHCKGNPENCKGRQGPGNSEQ